MPAHGQWRYQVGEPFYFYDLRAEVVHNGQYKEIVLIDEEEVLAKKRPFLMIIWCNWIHLYNSIRMHISRRPAILILSGLSSGLCSSCSGWISCLGSAFAFLTLPLARPSFRISILCWVRWRGPSEGSPDFVSLKSSRLFWGLSRWGWSQLS